MNSPEISSHESPELTCSAERDEVAALGGLLLALAARTLEAPERTESGYRLRLIASDEVEATLDEFTRRDKACCPFLHFEIERSDEEIALEVRGPKEASRLLDLTVEFARLGADPRGG